VTAQLERPAVSPVEVGNLEVLLRERQVRSVQPLVDLATESIIGYEALPRGPQRPLAVPNSYRPLPAALVGCRDWTKCVGALPSPTRPQPGSRLR
jgi:hypothetical protein